MNQDAVFMTRALELASLAAAAGEVPVGAVLVKDDCVIAEGWNRSVGSADPVGHAELVVLRAAAERLDNYRLPGTTLYVSLEPCAMCAGALVHARIARLVFAACEPKAGAVCSHLRLLDQPWLNHRVAWSGGLMGEESAQLLRQFFAERRLSSLKRGESQGTQ